MAVAERFICVRRSNIPDSVLQVLDLWPNTSQRNLIYDPPGQTKYLRRPDQDVVSTSGAGPITLNEAFSGIAAYLIDNLENGGLAAGVNAITAANAVTIQAAIITALNAGTAMTLGNLNTIIQLTCADTELTNGGGSASTGNLIEFLRILAGAYYTTPAGAQIETIANVKDIRRGSFDTTKYLRTVEGGAFNDSMIYGTLSKMTAATFTYLGTASAAVVVYDDTGAVV
jgi:hypothetical protein